MPACPRNEGLHDIEFSVLGSGSSGNASLVRSSGTAILVDAGISCRQLSLRLESLGQDPAALDAILLTHEHSDHTRGLPILCRRHPGIPVYASRMTRRIVEEKLDHPPEWRVIPAGGSFALGEFEISSFPVPHDAIDPLGFVLRKGPTRLGMLTDAGHVTRTIRRRLVGCHGLFIEANYDPELLEADVRRPWSVKQRIMGLHGHLSNEQAAELIRELLHEDLQHLVCGHLSSDCNTAGKVTEALAATHVGGARENPGFLVSGRDRPTPLLRISATRDTSAPATREIPHAVQGDLFGTP